MFSKFKKRLGVFTAIALMSALVPALSVSTASAAPATAAAPHTNEASSTYSACPTGSAPAAGFTDTTSTDVDCIAMYGITTGVTATTYEPSASIPRWQMALYLTRMASKAGVTLGSGADQGFTDISGYSAAIQTAINQIKQLGVTTGTTATTYSPDDNVTREQMAMFIERLLGQTATGQGGNADADAAGLTLYVNSSDTVTANYNYDDIDSGSVTFEGHNAIVEMWQLGITGDLTTNRSYRPSAAMTRAEMATFVTNALGHTNVRPAGLWLQASKSAGFANTAPTLTASYRDSSHAAVSGKVIDFFEWQNAATTADNSAHTATGACATATALTTNSLTKCKVEVGDPTTDTKGNIASFSESVTNAKTMSYFAWSAAAGTTFDLDLHGSGDDYSTINVSSSTPASVLLMSTNVNPYAAVGADPYPTTVKYGDSVTITAQMSAAKVGASWAAVAQPLTKVTFTHTIEAVAADTVESVTTTNVYTDANGTATYTFTDADPLATAGTGDTTHTIVVSDDNAGTTLTTAAAAGYAGHFMTVGSTVEVDFTDDAIAYSSTGLATNTTSYKAGSALLPVARSVTATNRDQYGNAHTASSGSTIKFQGAVVSGTGLLSCVDASDLCYFQGARVPSASGVAVTGVAASNVITMVGHGLAVGDAVAWDTGSTDLLNGDNAVNEVVYVKTVPSADTLTLGAVSSGGTVIGLTANIDDCGASPWTNCALYRVESHGLTGTESVILRTASTELAGTYTANTRYYVAAAGLTAHEFGLNTTANADAVMDVVTTPSDDCTLTTCEMFIYHPSATADRTIGPDGTASVAWNDTTSTNGADTVSTYWSTTKEASKTAYRYLAAAAATTISDSGETAIAWTEDAGNDAGYIDAQPLIWDNANNTLLVKLNHGIANSAVAASTHVAATHVRSVDYVQYAYDANDQFFLTADGTAAATTMAAFEVQLTTHMAANAGIAFAVGDLWSVSYQALAGNVSVFKLGT